MNWVKVSSSRVSEIAFDPINNKVYVKFKSNGKIYVYHNISESTFKQFANAPSIGKAISLLGKNYNETN